MPCERIGTAIICSPYRRKFHWFFRTYYVEEGGWGRGITDADGDGLFPEDYKYIDHLKYLYFIKQLTKGAKKRET